MQKTTDEIYKWINSPEGQKALQESHDKTEQYLKEFHNKEWNLQDWINLMFIPYRQITDLQAQVSNLQCCGNCLLSRIADGCKYKYMPTHRHCGDWQFDNLTREERK